jgi:hypothetical protein
LKKADAPCFTLGNFKKDAIERLSHGRPRGYRPIVRPSENVRMTTLFPEAVWEYNHRASGVKPKESKSKHFAHRAFEVWSVLYPDKSFGPDNKNIISYSMAAMVYAEIQLKRKVDWRTLLTRNKEDRTGYAKVDIPDNFTFFSQKVGVQPALDALGANQNTSRSTRTV